MLDNKGIRIKEFNNYKASIDKWYNKENKILSIITNPYNTNLIFTDIIQKLISENKKVLYVISDEKYGKNIIEYLRKKDLKFTYSYVKENIMQSDITIVNYKNINKIKDFYDLVIIDDISSYSNISNDEIVRAVESIYIYSKKIIIYTMERIIKVGYCLEISDLIRKNLFVEPRFITTRVNLDEDIPYLLYDYLIWFREMKRKVIIYVPTEEKVNNIYNYYVDKLKLRDIRIIKYLNSFTDKDVENIYKIKDKTVFIITQNLMKYDLEDMDIVVLYCDNKQYNYKKLTYLSTGIKNDKNIIQKREVILVSNEISDDMDKSKELIRSYNKKIWEKGLLNS